MLKRKIRMVLFLILGFFLLLLKPYKVNAVYNLMATPNESSVTLTATGCEESGNYMIKIYNSSDKTIPIQASAAFPFNIGEEVSRSFSSLKSDNYRATLTYGPDEVASTNFSITKEEIAPLKCGDKCNSNDSNCPSECESILRRDGQWKCCGNGYKSSLCKEDIVTTNYDPFVGCEEKPNSINTSLGCVPVEVKSFVPWLLNILFGIAGGIAFLLMVYGFILIATSGGDEKKVAGARETITSAIVGLLVCIFSIFILRLIAVNILQIPGF